MYHGRMGSGVRFLFMSLSTAAAALTVLGCMLPTGGTGDGAPSGGATETTTGGATGGGEAAGGGGAGGGAGGGGGAGEGGQGGQPLACAELNPTDIPPPVCSSGGPPRTVRFVNRCSSEPVDVYWVDNNCQEVHYFELAPGQSRMQSSYVGHLWRIRNADTDELLKDTGPITDGTQEFAVP